MATRPEPGNAPAPAKGTDDAPKTLEERIDEGLEESFPASDPPAVHEPKKKR